MESWYTNANLVSIVFVYTEISKEDYERIKTNFLIEKNKESYSYLSDTDKLNISLPYNIPLNNNYLDWGEEVDKEGDNIKITSILFNPSLRADIYILIKKINSGETLVTFYSLKGNTVLFYFF